MDNSPEFIRVLILRLMFLSVLIPIPLNLIVNCFPDNFIYFFSEIAEIYLDTDMYILIVLMTFYVLAKNFQSTMQGILRGLGIMKPTIISCSCSFLILLPSLGLMLTKVFRLDVRGLLIAGMTINLINGISLLIILLKTDYEECCKEYIANNSQENLENHYLPLVESNLQSEKLLN